MANEFKIKKGLIVTGSGGTLLDVQGSVGQVFSITDSLTGDIFSVSDVSGIPILNVNSSGKVEIDGNATFAGTIDSGSITATNSSSAQLQVNGWSDATGAHSANGTIYLGNIATYRGVIDYSATSGYLIISNTWDNDTGNIIFKTKTAGTDVVPLTLYGSGNAAFAGNIDVNGTEITVGTNGSRFAENNLRFKSSGAAYIDHNTTGQSFIFRTSTSSSLDTTALTLTSAGNATFAGDVSVGDDLTVADDANIAGTLNVGTTSPSSNSNYGSGDLNVENDSYAAIQIMSHSSTVGNYSFLGLGKSSGTGASPTISVAEETVGAIRYYGYDGNDYRALATISADVDGTPGDDDMPGRLEFFTTADGATTPTKRLTIGANGAATFTSDVTVTGNLIVNGTTTTLNTTTVEVEDNILQLNTTQGTPDTATAATSGISIYRGVDGDGNAVTQASLIFDDADDTWDLTNNLNIGGNVVSSGYVQAFGLLYLRSSVEVMNKAADGFLSLATRDTSGSEAVYNISNVGTIATAGNATFAGDVTIKNASVAKLKAAPLGSTYGAGFDVMTVTGTSSAPYTSTIGFSNYSATDVLKLVGSNATFAGAVSTGGYLTLNSSDSIPRLVFNGGGDDFMFSNTANYFGLYNDTDSRWDIKVDGVGNTTFAGNVVVDKQVVGVRKNLLTSESWTTGGFNMTGYFGGDFSGSEASNAYKEGPYQTRELVQETVPDSGNDWDGGWNKSINNLDINKAYMSIVYVKRVTSQTSGSFYHGTGAGTNQIFNLAGTANTNPYFISVNIGTLPQDVWCVSVGYIQANNDSNTANGNWKGQGLYRLDTGERIYEGTAYKMGSAGATLSTGHRVFLYYSTDNTSKLQFARPGFYEVNGHHPTINELVNPGGYAYQGTTNNRTFAGNVTLSSTAPIFYLDNTTSSTGKKWRLSSAANGKMYITQDGVIDAVTLDHTSGNATFAGTVTSPIVSSTSFRASTSSTTDSVLKLTDIGVADYDFTFPDTGTIQLGTNTTSTKTFKLVNAGSGNFNFEAGNATFSGNVTTPQINLNSSGGGVIDNQTGNIFIQTPAGTGWIFRNGASGYDEKMRITSGGNVGIGTSTPNAKLDVQGTQGQLFSVTDDLSGEIFAVADISGVPIFDVNSSGLSTFYGNVNLPDNKKILLGTGNDLQIYHDGSNSYINELGTGDLYIQTNGTNMFLRNSANGDTFVAMNTGTRNVQLRHANSTKLETTSTGATITGTITATGDVIAYSDARLKTEVKNLDGNKVYQMRGVSFVKDDKKGSGVIAQEMQEVAPELVKDDGEYLGVAYGNLTGYLIEAIKDLKAEIEELKSNKCNCNK